MSDYTTKNIEDVVVGDKVIGRKSINTVVELDPTVLGNRHLYAINGGTPFVTAEHPFMTTDGWKAIDPQMTIDEGHTAFSNEDDIGQLDVADTLIKWADPENMLTTGNTPVTAIASSTAADSTALYNFILDGDHTYYADTYLVHNKGGTNVVQSNTFNGPA